MTTDAPTLRWIRRLATAAVLAVAALWLASTLATIANYGLRHPAFDEFRLYAWYLDLPFPASALQLENGHRPIVPALLRIAEVRWADADHSLQAGGGVLLLLATLWGIAWTAWRERTSGPVGAALVLLSVLGVAWLGLARTLIHGFESLHMHLVTACAVFAMLSLWRATRSPRPGAWTALAGTLALLASFSFGTGVAVFPAVLIVAGLLRLPRRALVPPLALAAVGAIAYLVSLPGDDGVRGAIAVRPLDNLAVALRWLSGPFFHAWLGFADPALLSWRPGASALESTMTAAARGVARTLGDAWLARAGLAIGALGVAAWAAVVVRAWRAPDRWSATRTLGIGLSTFALGVGGLVALARLAYFDGAPMQILADRYQPWTCLFWLGLALAISPRRGDATSFAGSVAWPAVALMLAVLLFPSHAGLAAWSAAVHRIVAHSAVAAQLGLHDPQRRPSADDASPAFVERTLAAMQARRLSMFAEPAYGWLVEGRRFRADGAFVPSVAHAARVREIDGVGGSPRAVAIEGWVSRIEGRPRDAALVVVDADGAIRGLARFTFVGPDKLALRLNVPGKRGFDGYVVDPRPGEVLRVLVVDPRSGRVLAQVPQVH